jgi:dihydrodipicolinate synthase/N-acetylneuraminate lyase
VRPSEFPGTRPVGPVRGVCAVLEAPLTSEQELDGRSFDRLLDRVLASGVDGVMLPGFATEHGRLSEAERDRLVRSALERTRGDDRVVGVVSVSEQSTRLAVGAAERAVALGADALNVLPPSWLAPPLPAVRAHVAAVLAAVDPLPVVVQLAPAQTGAALSAEDLRELATAHGNLAAAKVESVPPGQVVSDLVSGTPPVPVLTGYGGMFVIDGWMRGASGVQPGCSHVEVHVALWRALEEGRTEDAARLHARLLPYLSVWMQHVDTIVAAEKRISARRGWIATDVCRTPSRGLDARDLTLVDAFLDEFGDLLTTGARTGCDG